MKLETYKERHYCSKGKWSMAVTPFSPEEGLARVHDVCGCKGRFDCDCVSVVNKVHSELWYEHNTRDHK